ncbi:MAG: D-tagatose-bisphosphate aldolase, class II, non-catalytic subunit [Kordiimonadaceae bacterium]|nr:D-tagatose-bisphosphate aldolase, class II, non-catalytic subunit [Kordiimonadaceae bacterium]MBT6031957.1 D-tagatose-bisphosphate aldolase, class II, non-catalytic subunit [Kordiimonadaceae bacterium]
MKYFLDLIAQHKESGANGIYSVCSAHPLVIEASLQHAAAVGGKALIEATSNQVNQDGGYTGMLPIDFCNRVYDIADKINFPREDILFGGDHLGPNCWQDLDADEAMEKSKLLIEQYVAAGFRKIHLDCSMSCNGDPVPLTDEIVAARAAILCEVSENTWKKVGGEAPVYIVGTEVPVPGGAQEALDELAVTSTDAASMTISVHEKAFTDAGLGDVWPRVIGLVVQPGVEFDHHKVIDYIPSKATELSKFIEDFPTMVYEAHSTDYQTAENFKSLVQDHFAILKVGPALTYALREALWALDNIEREWFGNKASNLKAITLDVMNEKPIYWQKYYSEEGDKMAFALEYSLSDRIRYYWPQPAIEQALSKMIENLDNNPPPLTLISQYMPVQYHAIRNGDIKADAKSLIIHQIMTVLQLYSDACNEN